LNKTEHLERAERFAREQLERLNGMEADAKLLQDAGQPKQAAKIMRETAKLRRQYERALAGMAARRTAADARAGAMVSNTIAEIERNIAAHEAGVDRERDSNV
jgi:hypothetical protein